MDADTTRNTENYRWKHNPDRLINKQHWEAESIKKSQTMHVRMAISIVHIENEAGKQKNIFQNELFSIENKQKQHYTTPNLLISVS